MTDYEIICKKCQEDEYYTGCDADKCTIWLKYQGYSIEEIEEMQDAYLN